LGGEKGALERAHEQLAQAQKMEALLNPTGVVSSWNAGAERGRGPA